MKLKAQDYTIGWICGNSLDLTAARSMLHEQHETPEEHESDKWYRNQIIIPGRLANHNIIIAGWPNGTGSIASAVTVPNLMRNYSNIRLLLLVGIGGGIPNPYSDIRLGDVVIGQSRGGLGAVVQYDHVRSKLGKIELMGMMNDPPMVLRNALTILKSNHRLGYSMIESIIAEALQRHPRLEKLCKQPKRETDLLFNPDYVHVSGAVNCSPCDQNYVISRVSRSEPEPKIHYGVIASSNRIVKDPHVRISLFEELGAICVEMDAAGIMNDLPCLVIKGISDYADTHKNEVWQGYASMTAAAYAKQLLLIVPTLEVYNDVRVAHILDLPKEYTPGIVRDSASQSSTILGEFDPVLEDTVLSKLAQAFAHDTTFRAIYIAASLRLSKPVLDRHVRSSLITFSKLFKKQATVPFEIAVAWMLKHYEQNLAWRIGELIEPSHGDLATFATTLDQIPSAQHEQLRLFLSEKFPIPNLPTSHERHPQFESEEYESKRDENEIEGEDEDEEPIDPATLTDLSNIEQVLRSSYEFNEMRVRMKNSVFPSAFEIITRTLRRHFTSQEQVIDVDCSVEWELLEYLSQEDTKIDEIDSILTLSGELDSACAMRLEDYVASTWDQGRQILNLVKSMVSTSVLEGSSQQNLSLHDQFSINTMMSSTLPGELVMLSIHGTVSQVVQCLSQFAWLAAVLRPHAEGRLTVSEIEFGIPSNEVDTIQMHQSSQRPMFRLSLMGEDKALAPDADQMGQCWTALFTESTLARGFELPQNQRPEDILGLEAPFEIISAFLGVRFPLLVNDRVVFMGESGVIIPKITFGSSIQWRFLKIEEWLSKVSTHTKISDPSLQNLDIQQISMSRAFLGYCRVSETLLGTSEFLRVDAVDSEVPRTGNTFSLKLEGPLGVGVSAKGYVTISAGTSWKLNRGEAALIQATNISQDERFRRSARTPTLLYDMNACIGFLVPELSVIYQMVITYLRKNTRLQQSKIPLAKITDDGGQACYEAIEQAKDLDVPQGTGSRKLNDIVDDFINILEQRKSQATVRRQFVEVSIEKNLRGWDYSDLQSKKLEFWERELPAGLFGAKLPGGYPTWWEMFETPVVSVLFTRIPRHPIRRQTVVDGFPHCCSAWTEFPTGAHVLFANVAQLEQLREETCQNARTYPTRYMLTNKLCWARPTGSRLFEQSCQEGLSCTPLQSVAKVDFFTRKGKKLYSAIGGHRTFDKHPGVMERTGAALFVSDPYMFSKRRCVLNGALHNQPPTVADEAGADYFEHKLFLFASLMLVIFAATVSMLQKLISQILG